MPWVQLPAVKGGPSYGFTEYDASICINERFVLGLKSGFERNLLRRTATIEATFDTASAEMMSSADPVHWLKLIGDLAGWMTFAFTAFITLIAGFCGRSEAQGGQQADKRGVGADESNRSEVNTN